MTRKFIDLIRREIQLVGISFLLTILAFVLLAIWRHYDSQTFSFQQIIFICLFMGMAIYGLTMFGRGKYASLLVGKELATILLIFTVLSFLILNIDRSRSFYLLKWVEISSSSGISADELSSRIGFSKIERADIEQRIEEQVSSGTLKIDQGKMKLTILGRTLTSIFNFIAKFENLKGYPNSW